LDRGFGRPAQAIQAAENDTPFTIMHLIAARQSSIEINREREEQERLLREPRVINGEATKAQDTAVSTPVNLFEPALE
jgi:hypothetical protein